MHSPRLRRGLAAALPPDVSRLAAGEAARQAGSVWQAAALLLTAKNKNKYPNSIKNFYLTATYPYSLTQIELHGRGKIYPCWLFLLTSPGAQAPGKAGSQAGYVRTLLATQPSEAA